MSFDLKDLQEIDGYLSSLTQMQLEDLLATIQKYKERPVDILEFMDSDRFLGKFWNGGLYPYWRKVYQDIYPSPFYSPYWLCMSGDTDIRLLDGRILQLKDVVGEVCENKKLYAISFDTKTKEWVPGRIRRGCSSGTKLVYKITLDSGKSFKVTSNHKILTRENKYKSIDDGLVSGDSLMPFSVKMGGGYLSIMGVSDGYYRSLYKRVAAWKFGKVPTGFCVHHKNFNKIDNCPENLCVTRKADHLRYHVRNINGMLARFWNKFNADEVFAKEYRAKKSIQMKKRWENMSTKERELFKDKLSRRQRLRCSNNPKFSKFMSETVKKLWEVDRNKMSIVVRKNQIQSVNKYHNDKEFHDSQNKKWLENLEKANKANEGVDLKARCNKARDLLWNSPEYADSRKQHKKKLTEHMNNSDQARIMGKRAWELGGEELRKKVASNNKLKNASHEFQLKCRRNKIINMCYRKYRETGEIVYNETTVNKYFTSTLEFEGIIKSFNHKITSIECVGEEEVFDIEVDTYHNFAIEAGVVVHNCFLRGCIGAGKTSVGLGGFAYDLYLNLIQENPQSNYGLLESTKMVFAIFNRTMKLSTDVVWDKLSSMFVASPFFNSLADVMRKKRKEETLFPNRIDVVIGSRAGHGLGQAIFDTFISEANFEVVDNQFQSTFNEMLNRMQSRFMLPGGGIPGKIWIDSSETEKFSVVNKIADSYKHDKGVYVSQVSSWEVKPHKYGTKRFWVFIGSDVRQPEIVADDNPVLQKEPERCIQVPEEHKSQFTADVHEALRAIAGRPTVSSYKFIRLRDRFIACQTISPLFPEIISLDFDDDTDQLMNYLIAPNYFKNPLHPKCVKYIHCDIGLTGDRLGLAASYVSGFRERKVMDISTLDTVVEQAPEIVTEWAFAVIPKPGKQVPLFKIRSFIQQLVKIGYSVGEANFDGFQSADSVQLLNKVGIASSVQSVDRESAPYFKFRDAVYEGRSSLPRNELLKTEALELEYNLKDDKVDHPDTFENNVKGSKDVTDAVCGSVNRAIDNAHKYHYMKLLGEGATSSVAASETFKNTFWPDKG